MLRPQSRRTSGIALVLAALLFLLLHDHAEAGTPDPSRSATSLEGQGAPCQFRFRADGGLDHMMVRVTLRDAFDVPVAGCRTTATIELLGASPGGGVCGYTSPGGAAICVPCGEERSGFTDADGIVAFEFAALGGRGDAEVRVTSWCKGSIEIAREGFAFTSPDLDGSCDTGAGGAVTVGDLGIWAAGLPPAAPRSASDYDCDCDVDVADLAIFAGGLGVPAGTYPCPVASFCDVAPQKTVSITAPNTIWVWNEPSHQTEDGLADSTAFKTIAQATAVAGPGDLIRVKHHDAYVEDVVVPSGVTLTADSPQIGASTPSIWGTGFGPAVTIASPSSLTRVIGFHISGGCATKGGGIHSQPGSGPVLIANCVVSNNAAQDGGGICVETSVAEIASTVICQNTATANGGGLCVASSAGDSVRVVECRILENEAAAEGGGVYSSDAGAARARSSLRAAPGFVLRVESTDVVSNRSKGSGGGLAVRSGELTLLGCTVDADSSEANGGGIFVSGSDAAFVADLPGGDTNFFTRNVADSSGGAMAVVDGAKITMKHQLIGDDVDTANGNVALADTTFHGGGGGIFLAGTGTTADLDSTVVVAGNSAPNGFGGGILTAIEEPGGASTVTRGGIDCNQCSYPFAPLEIYVGAKFNEGLFGGGIAVLAGPVEITSSGGGFHDNRAPLGPGGALLFWPRIGPIDALVGGNAGTLGLNRPAAVFEDNWAGTFGGAIAVMSGAFQGYDVCLTISGCDIGSPGKGNTANTFGGAIGIQKINGGDSGAISVYIGGQNTEAMDSPTIGLAPHRCGNFIQSNGEEMTFAGPVADGGAIGVDGVFDPLTDVIQIDGNMIGGELFTEGNYADTRGGGVWLRNGLLGHFVQLGTPYLSVPNSLTNILWNNTTGPNGGGGAVAIEGPATVVMQNNKVGDDQDEANRAGTRGGGGIYIDLAGGEVAGTLIGGPDNEDANLIKDNEASTGSGGGIHVDGGAGDDATTGPRLTIQGNEILGNNAIYGGGLAYTNVSDGDQSDVWDNRFDSNEAAGEGGAIFVHDTVSLRIGGVSTPQVPRTLNSIAGNSAQGLGGGVMGVRADGLKIEVNDIFRNGSGGSGGGVALVECDTVVVAQNTIDRNQCRQTPASVLPGPDGGGIYVDSQCEAPFIGFNLVRKCLAQGNGGAISLGASASLVQNNTMIANHSMFVDSELHLSAGAGMQIERNIVLHHGSQSSYAVWASSPSNATFTENDLLNYNGALLNFTTTLPVTNISAQPLFCDPVEKEAAPFVNYALSPNSPCVIAPGVYMGYLDVLCGTPAPAQESVEVLPGASIQAALDGLAMDGLDYGDEVVLAPGVHSESITVRPGVRVRSRADSAGVQDQIDQTILVGRVTLVAAAIDTTQSKAHYETVVAGLTLAGSTGGVVVGAGLEGANVVDCVIRDQAGAAVQQSSPAEIVYPWIANNTIVSNAVGISTACVSALLSKNIVDLNGMGYDCGADCDNTIPIPMLVCNVVADSIGGNFCPDPFAANVNFSFDPLFCDASADDYSLQGGSQAASGACGYLGALNPAIYSCPTGATVVAVAAAPDPASFDDRGVPDGFGAERPETAAETRLEFRLHPSFPNPVRSSATIRFDLPERADVRLRIYDATGRLVRELAAGTRRPGRHEVTWDGRNRSGRRPAAGVYFYRLEAGRHHETSRLLLLK